MSLLVPPSVVRSMKTLNRELFNKIVAVPSLKVEENKIASILKNLKKYLLKMDNFKPIQESEKEPLEDHIECIKNVYLDPHIIKSWTDIQIEDREKLINSGVTEKYFKSSDVELKYENWKADEILKAILPTDKDSLTSYSNIGHIVHVNLKDHLLEYKEVIGQVLLDKIKHCETVINKTNAIDNTFRNFHLEVLSGKAEFKTKVKENNCSFEFDFSKVYWNPRLSTEHLRITNMLKKGDVLFDVFAGVGPFAIPCLKKGCTVYANDLNPDSFQWLMHNAKLNKTTKNFKAFNLDAKDFICNTVPKLLAELYSSNSVGNIYFTMNLPAMSVEFLTNFRGILQQYNIDEFQNFKQPIIHVYCFVSGDDSVNEAKRLVENNLKCELKENLIEIFNVRNVSPHKEMYRISFHLSKDILFQSTTVNENNCTNKRKREDDEC